ncbi:TonB-dependent receptor [Aurantibacillus circumpalustris]|uniref:TonB-dependent receptor n=1 Tax=Aurantibacillus circumpalustris TaxID=3036359 RepID=UPI00295B27CC|nr:TonB-dependent receptor [Aurantibacillus circumpalustris]
MKKYFILFFSFFCLNSFSQIITQTIRGTIIDKQSQATLPGVAVFLINSNPILGASTDEKGEFKIQNVPIGRWQIKVQAISYKENYVTVELNSGKESVLIVELEESVLQGEEVIITAIQDKTETNNKMSTVSARVFSAEEAGRYAGSRNDPARMAANYAGVSGANDSRNDIIIRGNSPLGILWRLNGIDIPNPNHFGNTGSTGGPISILNNNTLGSSDFMTGAFVADYGNATSGVFDLKMRQGNNEKHEFVGQVGFNGFELGAEGPFSKSKNSTFIVNYRYSTLAVFKALNIDFGAGAAVPQYQDITFKADFATKKFGKISFWGIGGLSYVALLESDKKEGQDLYGYSARDTYFRSNVGASGISHIILFKKSAYLKTNIGISGSQNIILADRIDSSFKTPKNLKPEYRQTTQNVRYSLNTTYNKKFNSRNFINLGIYSEVYKTVFVDSNDYLFGDNTFITLRNYSGTTAVLRAFLQWQHKFSDKFLINLGISDQVFLLNNSNAIEPRVGLKYALNQKQAFSFGAGLHSQLQPTYIYFATDTARNNRVETNKNLDFTRAAHAVLAYDNNFSANFRLKTEVYYQYIYNAPVKNYPNYFSVLNLGADFNSPNVSNLVSKGTGFNYGLEITLEKFYSKGFYFLWTSSFFESKYLASDGVIRNTAFNGNYVFNLLGGKEFRIKQKHVFSIDIRATYAGGKRYTPIDLNASIAANAEVRDVSQAFQQQYSPYFRMDVKPGYRYNAKKVTHEFTIDLQNVTRNLNVFQQTYDLTNKTINTNYQLKFFVIPQYRILF